MGVDDVIPMTPWNKYFLNYQGYSTNTDIFHDNQTSILIEQNGRESNKKRTSHINTRYFFISDRVKSGEVKIKYCPTDGTIGEYFTNLLQGYKFRKFKGKISNI